MSSWRIFDRFVLRALGALPALPSIATPITARTQTPPAQAVPLASWNEG